MIARGALGKAEIVRGIVKLGLHMRVIGLTVWVSAWFKNVWAMWW